MCLEIYGLMGFGNTQQTKIYFVRAALALWRLLVRRYRIQHSDLLYVVPVFLTVRR